MGALAVEPIVAGRYALFDVIAAGGMATVHLGRLLGPVGFSRTVAIKRLHVEYARDPEFVSMFLDEARLAARIRHPNVVQTVDVVATKGELFLVMDYVQGESLSRLLRIISAGTEMMPLRVAVSVLSGMLQGLHAAHIAKDEHGVELGIVHRDVSPQNVLVGIDGMARVLDFGIAKAAGRMQTTRDGQVKGKLAYMAPEQVYGETLLRSADVYAAGVVAWEVLTGKRLFKADNETTVLAKVLAGVVNPPSSVASHVPKEIDDVVMKSLSRDPTARFQTAKEMSAALERAIAPASHADVAEWVEQIAGTALAQRALLVAKVETDSGVSSVESLKQRMLDELAKKSEPPTEEPTSTKIGIGAPVEPIQRSTARLESAAKQALARLAAEEEAKSKSPDSLAAPAATPPVEARPPEPARAAPAPAPAQSPPVAPQIAPPAAPQSAPQIAPPPRIVAPAPPVMVVAPLPPPSDPRAVPPPRSDPRVAAHSQPNLPAFAIAEEIELPKRSRAPTVIALAVVLALSATAVGFIVVKSSASAKEGGESAPARSADSVASSLTSGAIDESATSDPTAKTSASVDTTTNGASAQAPSASAAQMPSAHGALRAPSRPHGTLSPNTESPSKDPFDLGGRR